MTPQTVIRGGDGTSVAAYTLPPGVFQYIQSVLVQVDNAAGGDIRPTLSVQTQDGVVMATKRQGETIPAGDTGSATWALRLTDEGATNTLGLHWGVNVDSTSLGLQLDSQGPYVFNGQSTWQVDWDVGAYTIKTNGGTFQVDTGGGGAQFVNGPFEADTNGQDVLLNPQGGAVRIVSGGVGTGDLAFFGVAPVGQQATPVTLADVIALLQAYGLAA